MNKKKLPTGVVNYEKLIKGNYYIVDTRCAVRQLDVENIAGGNPVQ